ncbi:hypothetical protein JZ751_020131 [Albula glossodonta]|uniref:Proline-rich protein 7 n=1 Tax=Albula glossodonta TaxID=121402 RepID=A0A8T2NTU1_9TELE|nr:hypothetical protein JZ751_020131 [Albula glossodonta]
MVMSQGTYTFLTCFAGFWLVWALVVLLCCFCNSLQRRLKRRRDHRLRLHSMDTPPATREPGPQSPGPPPARRTTPADGDVLGKPPCYEEAVLMDDPPPPYSAVLGDARVGTNPDSVGGPPECGEQTSRELQNTETSKTGPDVRGHSSLIHLPAVGHWDSLQPLLSAVELNCSNLSNPALAPIATPTPTLAPVYFHLNFLSF